MIDMQCGTEDLFPVKEHQNDTQWSTEERSSLSEDGQDDRRKADAQQLHIRKPYLIGLSSLNCLIVTLYTTAFFSEILCCVTFCVFPLCCRARDGSCVYSSGYKHSIGDGDTKPFSPWTWTWTCSFHGFSSSDKQAFLDEHVARCTKSQSGRHRLNDLEIHVLYLANRNSQAATCMHLDSHNVVCSRSQTLQDFTAVTSTECSLSYMRSRWMPRYQRGLRPRLICDQYCQTTITSFSCCRSAISIDNWRKPQVEL
jgi:hypothetical protein